MYLDNTKRFNKIYTHTHTHTRITVTLSKFGSPMVFLQGRHRAALLNLFESCVFLDYRLYFPYAYGHKPVYQDSVKMLAISLNFNNSQLIWTLKHCSTQFNKWKTRQRYNNIPPKSVSIQTTKNRRKLHKINVRNYSCIKKQHQFFSLLY